MDRMRLETLAQRVRLLRRVTEAMIDDTAGIPALEANARRIEAGVRMLELDLGLCFEVAGGSPPNARP